jgi:hypothetical protein
VDDCVVGLDTPNASPHYIHLHLGRETLAESLDRVQRAASVILKAVSAPD